MALTRAELRTIVRSELDDDSYDSDVINRAANWFIDEVCNNNHLRRMEASEELNADTGDTEMELPDDMKTMISLYLTTPQVYDMKKDYLAYDDFMQSHADFASATSAQARQWTDFANGVRFAAPLNAAHVFNCDYLRKPVAAEDDEDEYDWPDGYDELLVFGAWARVVEREEDYEIASQKRDLMAGLRTAFIKNESRGQIKTGGNVIRTGRHRRTWSAKDF